MLDTLQHIWKWKELPTQLSHFGYTLLAHAIYRKVREITLEAQSCFFNFTPTVSDSSDKGGNARPDGPIIAEDSLSRWRNSACDSLDVLHWRMNAEIASSSGWEHPCVMFLHLSRLLTLSPVVDLQVLASDPVMLKYHFQHGGQFSADDLANARTHVVHWAVRDCFKARLCLVHAGAVFWHLKRYGTANTNGPFGVYLATLVLWAYSTISRISAITSARQSHDNESVSDHVTSLHDPGQVGHEICNLDTDIPFIYLDRPCDDEMIQQFVRDDRSITAFMQGVGRINGPEGPKKILRSGQYLLEHRSGPANHDRSPSDGFEHQNHLWEIEKNYAISLKRLEAVTI